MCECFGFTAELTHGDIMYAEVDGIALVEDDGIVEIKVHDFKTGEYLTVGGALEAEILLFLKTDEFYRDCIEERAALYRSGSKVADRATARAA